MVTFIDILKTLDKLGRGVEVGVMYGDHCAKLLDSLPSLEKLYAVDPYSSYQEDERPTSEDSSLTYMTSEALEWEKIAREHLAPYGERVEMIRLNSIDASENIRGSLDFVYIDACHSMESVTADIDAWYPLVRDGGVIGGHDIMWLGVWSAVTKFMKSGGHTLTITVNQWWIIKGK